MILYETLNASSSLTSFRGYSRKTAAFPYYQYYRVRQNTDILNDKELRCKLLQYTEKHGSLIPLLFGDNKNYPFRSGNRQKCRSQYFPYHKLPSELFHRIFQRAARLSGALPCQNPDLLYCLQMIHTKTQRKSFRLLCADAIRISALQTDLSYFKAIFRRHTCVR